MISSASESLRLRLARRTGSGLLSGRPGPAGSEYHLRILDSPMHCQALRRPGRAPPRSSESAVTVTGCCDRRRPRPGPAGLSPTVGLGSLGA